MLTILCEDKRRREKCNKEVCCHDCGVDNCSFRCDLEFIEQCVDFYEDID